MVITIPYNIKSVMIPYYRTLMIPYEIMDDNDSIQQIVDDDDSILQIINSIQKNCDLLTSIIITFS